MDKKSQVESFLMYLSANFQLVRKKWRLSQKAMGTVLDSNKGQITSYERGKAVPGIPLLIKLSDLSGLNIKDFFTRTIDVGEIPDNPLEEPKAGSVSDAKTKYSKEPTEDPQIIQQRKIIDHLLEENKLLKQQLKEKK